MLPDGKRKRHACDIPSLFLQAIQERQDHAWRVLQVECRLASPFGGPAHLRLNIRLITGIASHAERQTGGTQVESAPSRCLLVVCHWLVNRFRMV